MNDEQLIWERYKTILLEETKTDFTLEFVEELKNEFNNLISNIPTRIKNNNISNLIDAFEKVISKHETMMDIFVVWEKNKKIHAEYLRKPWWSFIISLGKTKRLLVDYSKDPSDYNLKPLINIKRVITKEAKLAWYYMDLFIRNNPGIDVKLKINLYEEIIGTIPFIFIGINDSNKQRVRRIKEFINYYIERARKVAPIMLKYKLPVEIHMEFGILQDENAAGLYAHNKIILTAWLSKTNEKLAFVKTLAHEMAHHIYRSLSETNRNFWDNAIHGDMGILNVKDVISMMHDGEKLRDFDERMRVEDPILSLKAETLFHHYSTQRLDIYDLESLINAYNEKRIGEEVRVPNTPITGYANKNTEEAFCESLGMLVSYGTRTVHEKIINLLKTILSANEGYKFNESLEEIYV
jgi:hypothetical protein